MIKARTLTVGTTVIEMVSEDPRRTSFFVQNLDDESKVRIYARKDNPYGAITVYPHSWISFEKEDDADKQWWTRVDTGSVDLIINEFYRQKQGWIW